MPSVAIKFTQNSPGPGVGTAGWALAGVTGTPVLVELVATGFTIAQAQFELVSVDERSAIAIGLKQAYSTDLDWQFTPDSRGGFLVRVRAKDASGAEYVDERMFLVPEQSGRYIPSNKASGSALNFVGTLLGWDKIMRTWMRAVETLTDAFTEWVRGTGLQRDYFESVTLANTNPTTVITHAVPDNTSARYVLFVVMRKPNGVSKVFSYYDQWQRTSAGAPTRFGTLLANADTGTDGDAGASSWTAQITTSGNNVIVSVVGENTVNVQARLQVFESA